MPQSPFYDEIRVPLTIIYDPPLDEMEQRIEQLVKEGYRVGVKVEHEFKFGRLYVTVSLTTEVKDEDQVDYHFVKEITANSLDIEYVPEVYDEEGDGSQTCQS